MRHSLSLGTLVVMMAFCGFVSVPARAQFATPSSQQNTGGQFGGGPFSSTAASPANQSTTQGLGPFGQGGQSDFFSGGLQTLGLAGLSAFFARGGTDTGPAQGQFNQASFGPTPFSAFGRPFGPGLDDRNRRRGRTAQLRIQPELRVAFPYPEVPASAIQARIEHLLTAELPQGIAGQIEVLVVEPPSLADGPTATASTSTAASANGALVVLRGTVATEDDRQVAERLVLLDPGVAQVQNELRVGPLETMPLPSPSSAARPNEPAGPPAIAPPIRTTP